VRELENLMERAAVLCRGREVTPAHLPVDVSDAPAPPAEPVSVSARESLALRPLVDGLEMELIGEALQRTDGNKAAAARLLEISERALWYKIKRYGM
jgi:two-component system response regulator AtoC